MSFKYFFNKDDDRKVQEDTEIQGFYQELTAARAMEGSGGCGMNVWYLYTLKLVKYEHGCSDFSDVGKFCLNPRYNSEQIFVKLYGDNEIGCYEFTDIANWFKIP